MVRNFQIGWRALILVLAWLLGPVSASNAANSWLDEEPEFLRVEQAFALTTAVVNDTLIARWQMPDGYYLYRHRFNFKTRDGAPFTLGAPKLSEGKKKTDEFFGDVEVYYHEAEAQIPIIVPAGQSLAGPIEVGVEYQGCADAGLCYPPELTWASLDVGVLVGGAAPGADSGGSASGDGNSSSLFLADNGEQVQKQSTASDISEPAFAAVAPSIVNETQQQQLKEVLANQSFIKALLLFFLAGIGLAFTPCVLPMVPILSSIIVGDNEDTGQTAAPSKFRGISLSVAYVLGMAITYAALGMLVGKFGAELNLQASLQSPPVLIFFAGVFVLLSLSMFGFYELQLPQSWQNGLNNIGQKAGGGKHLSVFVMGALSSLVVSPCVSAPLAGAVLYLSTEGSAVLGGSALFALGLGMGVPLLVIGASGGHLLPKAGGWMNGVKAVFGVLLLAVAVWLLERVIPAQLTLVLWAALAIGSAVYLGALDSSPRQGWMQLWKATGTLSLVYGVLLLVGAASGAENPLKPLEKLAGGQVSQPGAESGEVIWHAANNLAALQDQLSEGAAAGKPVMLDLYADWCISCKVMERSVFPQPQIQALFQQFRLVRADVTRNSAEHKALMTTYDVVGPPSMVFFAPDGTVITELTVQGEIHAKGLERHLQSVLNAVQLGQQVKDSPKVGEIAAIE